MKAVRGHHGSPAIVELDEPVGFEGGEVLDMAVAGICASDLNYLRLGTERSTNISSKYSGWVFENS